MASLSATAVETSKTTAGTVNGNILRKEGEHTPYIAKYTVDVEGKKTPVQETIFVGDSLIRKANGQCVLVRTRLEKMMETDIGGGLKIQAPQTATSVKNVPCIA